MIGFYDYTVILTYISFASSISGIFLATRGHFNWAIFCLAFSGLCDMFDGKIARTKKNRTEDEKRFGIQIDSLCDVVCFGVFPIVLCYELGMTHFYSIPILIFYGLAGVIRLGYFNVMEEKRQNETSENRKYYQGLPITSMSVALPLQSANFGTLLQMEVGAMMVGKIVNENAGAARRVQRGEEKGYFAFGGSTVIVLAQKGSAVPEKRIWNYSRLGIETRVRQGETVGTAGRTG